MIFTENIVVGKLSVNVMISGNVMPFIYRIKSFVVALFSAKPMNSANLMSVKVMHDCTFHAVYDKVYFRNPYDRVISHSHELTLIFTKLVTLSMELECNPSHSLINYLKI